MTRSNPNGRSPDPQELEALFLSNQALIDQVVDRVARRFGCSESDLEDFRSSVKLKLIENDYAILGQFQGKGTLRTFFTIVVANLFRDLRNKNWGKWRTSLKARTLGLWAIELEQLLYRDGFSLREAVEKLCAQYGTEAPSRERLSEIATQLKPRHPSRFFEGEESIHRLKASERTERTLIDQERCKIEQGVLSALEKALATLPAEDRLIIEWRFRDDLSVAQVARLLKLQQRPLYRRIPRLLAQMRQHLKHQGLGYNELKLIFDPEDMP